MKRRELKILLALAMAGSAGSARAQDAVEELGSTTVTATRSSEQTNKAPFSVGVIDLEQLKLERTVPEALEEISGLMIQKTTHGHGSPFIRGFTGRQNLLLVDGIRMNNSTYRSGPIQYWNTIDVGGIERLELVKGSGSVLYGSDALGGTLNVLSQGTSFREFDGSFSYGELSYKFDTNSSSHRGRIEQGFGVGNKWGVLIGVGAKDFGDIRSSALGRMQNTGYTEENLDLKFEYALSDDSTFTFAHQYLNQDDVWRWHSTVFSDPDGDGISWEHDGHVTAAGQNARRVYDQERSLTYAKFEHDIDASWAKRYSATLSYQRSQDSQDRIRGAAQSSPGRHDINIADVETYGFSFVAESEMNQGELVWGLDFYQDEVDTDGYRNGAFRAGNRPVADDSRYQSVGVFGQYVIGLSDRVEATFGARYTYAKAEWDASAPGDTSGDKSWDDLSLSARFNFQVNKQWRLYTGLSEAFRAPNLNDLTGNEVALSGLNVSGSTDIDPEELLTFEIGSQHLTDSYSINYAAYYTHIDNAIVRVNESAMSSDRIKANGPEAYVYGVEFDARWILSDQWELQARASWQDGKQKKVSFIGGPEIEDTIHRMAPLQGSISLKWTAQSGDLWIKGQLTGAQTQDNLSESTTDAERIPTGGTPHYLVASLYAGYELNQRTSFTLGLENLGDVDYRVHGSGLNMPGINAIIGVNYKW